MTEEKQLDALKKIAKGSLTEALEPTSKALPTIIPADDQGKLNFKKIKQGNATNTLTKLRDVEGKTAIVDAVTGTATIRKGRFSVTISNYEKLPRLKTSTYQLLDIITVAFTEAGGESPTVIVPLSVYMEWRGLKDRKGARKQVKEDLKVLRHLGITGEEKRGKRTETYSFVNIADSGELRRNGDIVFTFTSTFYNMLLKYPIMSYPVQLLKLNNKRNPNSFYLLRKIAEHKNMNVGKKNENIIAVKTLLAVAPFILSYEEVMEADRAVNRKIIEPFERDMDAFEEVLSWEYCHRNGQPLTDAELQALNYDIFKGLLVKLSWKSYPDQTARLEKKKKRLEQADKKNPATKKKPKGG